MLTAEDTDSIEAYMSLSARAWMTNASFHIPVSYEYYNSLAQCSAGVGMFGPWAYRIGHKELCEADVSI